MLYWLGIVEGSKIGSDDAERRGGHYHAERGNE